MEYLCSKKGSKLSQQIIITYSPLDFLWSNTLLVRRTKNVSIKQWALPCYSKKYQINWHTLNFCSKNWKSEKIEFIYLQIKSLLFQSQNNIKTLLVKKVFLQFSLLKFNSSMTIAKVISGVCLNCFTLKVRLQF